MPGHLLVTGPVKGTVTLDDGRVIDVSPALIELDSFEDVLAVADKIGERHAERGHPELAPDDTFVHTPSALTHNPDGTPSEAFAEVVAEHAGPDKDSSPAAVLATARKRAKG